MLYTNCQLSIIVELMHPDKAICIYSGEGVGERSLDSAVSSFKESFEDLPIKLITPKEVIDGKWKNDCLIFVMPGGADIPYLNALAGKGNKEIAAFVHDGGKYLGFCAGAYYACKEIEFEKGTGLEVVGERELKFFPAKAVGPAYGIGTYCYDKPIDSRLSPVIELSSSVTYNIYYSGGCYFEGAERFTTVSIIARYSDIEGMPAAVVECTVGKGKALLSGVHPEFSHSIVAKYASDRPSLIKEMEIIEKRRKEFFESLIKRLL
ncbi:MAG: hypothetical protein D6808_06915 [Candidatus Dadabacteria bacterium]|nr:MAG: hypothetical protein D6808_06915 [Candidatus Dadabacteria bacterium]